MYKIGGVDMKKPNALISMAYVSQNANNPYATFCVYIKYVIAVNSSDTMTLKELQTSLGKEFGVFLPYNILLKCMGMLSAQGVSQHEHWIQRTNSFEFDIESFDKTRLEYRHIETEIINDLIDYAKGHGRNWTFDYAREQLIKVLDRNGLAYDIFIHTKTLQGNHTQIDDNILNAEDLLADEEETENENIDEQPLFSDIFFVGKFIEKILIENTIKKDYLQQICEGLMLCVGTYQIPSANIDMTMPQINGTLFFFDTRLLLRFIGCAGEAAVVATKELVQLIQNGNGIICYFQHTLDEMISAFDEAISAMTSGDVPSDPEMRIYARITHNNVDVLRAKRASLKDELANSNIAIRQRELFSDNDKMRFGFSLEDLQQYMRNTLHWKSQAILNDAQSIWEVHMRREGNYTEYCGTQDRLAVFVTSNSRLIGVVLDYQHARPNVTEIRNWKPNRLPVITDIRLTCRLWSPVTQGERFALLYLTANSVAAQNPTKKYLNKIREYVIELSKTIPEYSSICLPEFFDDNITNAVFENTHGEENNLNISLFTNTLEELVEWKAKEQEETTLAITDERDSINEQYNNQTDDIIQGAVEQCCKKFKKYDLLLWIIINCSNIGAIALAGISVGVSLYTKSWKSLWLILLAMGLSVIEKAFQLATKPLLKKMLPCIENSYHKSAKKFLRKVEKQYEEKIIEAYCNKNKFFCKAKSICEKQ